MPNTLNRSEPRWPAVLALLAVGGLRLSLPESLSAGPDWLLIVVIAVLLVPTVWARRRGMDKVNRVMGYLLTSMMQAARVSVSCAASIRMEHSFFHK